MPRRRGGPLIIIFSVPRRSREPISPIHDRNRHDKTKEHLHFYLKYYVLFLPLFLDLASPFEGFPSSSVPSVQRAFLAFVCLFTFYWRQGVLTPFPNTACAARRGTAWHGISDLFYSFCLLGLQLHEIQHGWSQRGPVAWSYSLSDFWIFHFREVTSIQAKNGRMLVSRYSLLFIFSSLFSCLSHVSLSPSLSLSLSLLSSLSNVQRKYGGAHCRLDYCT